MYRHGRGTCRVVPRTARPISAALFGMCTVNDQSKAQRNLQQLLAQDLTAVGYEARIRHQRRIEALKVECAGASVHGQCATTTSEPVKPGES